LSRNIVWIRLLGDEYRLACLDGASGRMLCDWAGVRPGPEGRLAIPEAWGPKAGVRGARVFLDVPLKDLHVRFVDLPLSERDKVRDVLPFEAEGLFLSPLDAMVLDVHPLGRKNGSAYRYLVVGGNTQVLKTHIGRLAEAGFDPDVIGSSDLAALVDAEGGDPDPLALLNPTLDDDLRAAYVAGVVSSGGLSLRRGDLAETEKHRQQVRTRRKMVVLAVVFLGMLLANWGVRFWTIHTENNALEDDIRTVFRKIDPRNRQVEDEVYQARLAIKALDERVEALQGVPVLDALLSLSKAKKDQPRIVLKELRIREDHVTATGMAPSFGAVEKYRDSIAGEGMGTSRILESTVIQEGEVRFTIAAAPSEPERAVE